MYITDPVQALDMNLMGMLEGKAGVLCRLQRSQGARSWDKGRVLLVLQPEWPPPCVWDVHQGFLGIAQPSESYPDQHTNTTRP